MAVGRLQRVIPGGFPQCPTSVAPTAIVSHQLPPAATHWGGPQHLYPTGLKPPFEGAGGGPGSIQGWPMPCTGCPEMAAASVMPLPSQASTPPPQGILLKRATYRNTKGHILLYFKTRQVPQPLESTLGSPWPGKLSRQTVISKRREMFPSPREAQGDGTGQR